MAMLLGITPFETSISYDELALIILTILTLTVFYVTLTILMIASLWKVRKSRH